MIYSKIWASVQFGNLSNNAKLLYIGTITLADDEGKLNGNPSYLRGQIFPYDEKITVAEIKGFLKEMTSQNLITYYEVEGTEYIKHPNWEVYQKLRKDRMRESEIPDVNQVSTKSQPDDVQSAPQGKVSKDKVREGKVIAESSDSANNTNKFLNLFKDINPSYKQLFGNKTQRSAMERLLKEHGEKKIEWCLELLPQIAGKKYSPLITTPLQLENKLGELLVFMKKESGNKTRVVEI